MKYKKSPLKTAVVAVTVVAMMIIFPLSMASASEALKNHIGDQFLNLAAPEKLENLVEPNQPFEELTLDLDAYTIVDTTNLTRGSNTISKTLNSGEKSVLIAEHLDKGDTILINLVGSPSPCSFAITINTKQISSVNDGIHSESYTVPSNGTYTINLVNLSNKTITVVGFIEISE